MKTVLAICLALAAGLMALTAGAAPSSPPVVVANGEQLVGAWEAGEPAVAVFRGIPFAAPPVGSLRWRAPEAHQPRPGLQTATEFADACMQGEGMVDWYARVASAFGRDAPVVERPSGVSEDCLFLNVWSPRPDPAARLPVLVFVHGGSNSGGWSYEPNYRGAELARADAVVVTIAYRLGPFGFFAHEALGDGSAGPVANFALLDIRAAFDWVREHVAAFGGDPGRITAFGESAGAFNLLDLLLEDMATGTARSSPFQSLILQSIGGPMSGRRTLAEEMAVGARLAVLLGLREEVTADRLRAVPARDLLAAAEQLPEDYFPAGVIDGQVLTTERRAALSKAQAEGVRMILGTNADEWLMYLDEGTGRDDLLDWVRENDPQRAGALLAAVADEGDPRRALDRLITAREMLCPSLALAAAVSDNGGSAWAYHFSRRRAGRGGDLLGAYHGAELSYVFGTHDDWLPTGPVDRALTREMMDRWISFARQGSPEVAGRSSWPAYDSGRPLVLDLGETVRIIRPVDQELCESQVPTSAGNGVGG